MLKLQSLREALEAEVNEHKGSFVQELGDTLTVVLRKYGYGAGRKPATKQRKRSVITPAIKEQIRKMTAEGKTARQIAAVVHVSQASVVAWRRNLGLTRTAKLKPAAKSPKK